MSQNPDRLYGRPPGGQGAGAQRRAGGHRHHGDEESCIRDVRPGGDHDADEHHDEGSAELQRPAEQPLGLPGSVGSRHAERDRGHVEADQDQAIVLGEKFIMDESVKEQAKQAFIDWYKTQARQVIRARVDIYARRNGFVYTQFRITNAKTRWGSCGPKGSLNFSYRLVMAPLEIIDYVVCHELVHLKVKDHSKSFWKELEHLIPDYKQCKRWLKDNGHRLSIE